MELILALVLSLVVGFGVGFWTRKLTFRLPSPEPLKQLPETIIEYVPIPPNVVYVEPFEPEPLKVTHTVGEGNARRIHMADSRRTRL